MRRHNILLRPDDMSVRRAGGAVPDLGDKGIFKNRQPLGYGREKSQRVELRLRREFYRACRGKRQFSSVGGFGRISEAAQRLQLGGDFLRPVEGVDIAVPRLKITVHTGAKLPVFFQRVQVGTKIKTCPLRTEPPQQLGVNQAVLGGDFGRRVPGHAAADPPSLGQKDICSALFQHIGAEKPGNSSANHQHISRTVALQPREAGQRGLCAPHRFRHSIHPLLHTPFRIVFS